MTAKPLAGATHAAKEFMVLEPVWAKALPPAHERWWRPQPKA